MSSSELRRLMTLLEDATNRNMNEALNQDKNKIVDMVDTRSIRIAFKEHFRSPKFTINQQGEISVQGECIATNSGNWKEKIIPVNFKDVSGSFFCNHLNLTSLKGSPRTVGGTFCVINNRLTSLEDGPITVDGDYFCFTNQLTSLRGLPKILNGNLRCQENNLTSLDGLPESFTGTIALDFNPNLPLLRLLQCEEIFINSRIEENYSVINDILTKYCGDKFSRSSVIACQKELIDNGFEGNASW